MIPNAASDLLLVVLNHHVQHLAIIGAQDEDPEFDGNLPRNGHPSDNLGCQSVFDFLDILTQLVNMNHEAINRRLDRLDHPFGELLRDSFGNNLLEFGPSVVILSPRHEAILRPMKVRVIFEDGSQRDFPIAEGWGCSVSVANDAAGSLSINQSRQVESRVMNRFEIETRMLAVIRRNDANAAWREVVLIDADEPAVIELGQPKLAVN